MSRFVQLDEEPGQETLVRKEALEDFTQKLEALTKKVEPRRTRLEVWQSTESSTPLPTLGPADELPYKLLYKERKHWFDICRFIDVRNLAMHYKLLDYAGTLGNREKVKVMILAHEAEKGWIYPPTEEDVLASLSTVSP